MRCEDFWEKLPEFFPAEEGLTKDLEKHLEECPSCREELVLLETGFAELKQEVEQEQGAHFWHEMRANVRSSVKIPKPWALWEFNWWRFGWAATAITVMLLVFNLFYGHKTFLQEDELMLMAGIDPVVSVYEDSQVLVTECEEDQYDLYLNVDLTEGWSSLLAETVEDST